MPWLWHNTSLSKCRISECYGWAPELGPGTTTDNREEVATFWVLQGKGGNFLGVITCLSSVPWGILWTQCMAAKQKVSGHQTAACGASQTYRHLRSRHTPTTLCIDLHWGCRRPTTCQPWVHTGTEQSTSGILLLHYQPVLICDRDGTPRSPRAHQLTPAQRENLSSSPPSPHMEMTAAGTAQGGFPVESRPGVASSRLTGITLGDLLVKDRRHQGWALNSLKYLKNLSLQGFLKQKPWPVKTQLENILLDEDSPAKWAPTGCGTVARRWVPGYRVPSSFRVCHRGSDFTNRGPHPWLKVDTPAYSPQDSDCSSVIHAAPGLTQLHHTALHTAPGQAVCAVPSWQTWAQTHLQFLTWFPSWMSPCLSKPVCVPPAL